MQAPAVQVQVPPQAITPPAAQAPAIQVQPPPAAQGAPLSLSSGGSDQDSPAGRNKDGGKVAIYIDGKLPPGFAVSALTQGAGLEKPSGPLVERTGIGR